MVHPTLKLKVTISWHTFSTYCMFRLTITVVRDRVAVQICTDLTAGEIQVLCVGAQYLSSEDETKRNRSFDYLLHESFLHSRCVCFFLRGSDFPAVILKADRRCLLLVTGT